ncbi:uncharacterized protein EI90DRAFT_3044363 [Cantharellus anzutake]|uniref:uncharacterized protein n=1 Tax=Cantharellus anzutake TaxID=1750568 RepID=UPI001908A41D|nr:uncharacterized protein EI90DRAFT_3044363 [Cantharellus anzutake]KAF8336965.1 hypothetical protein EI90DRAFT_3044363 [Cantharellus anzutake]
MVQALIAHGGPDSLVVLCQNGAGMPSEIQTMVECIRFSDRDELRDKLTGVHRHVPLFSVGLNTNKYPDQWTTTTTIKFIEDTQTVKKITPFVILIQQRYRRLVARRVFESSEFQKVFLACAKSAEKIKFQSYQGSVHRFRFLVIVRGPLPHVLFALSRILVEVRNAKQAAKCRLDTTEPGDSIIECKNQITALNHCHERVSELQREIGPESAIFRSGSSTDLGPRVLEVDALLNKLESSSIGLDMEPLRFHMAIGIKGIVTPAPQKRPLKPSLNAEDLDWY